MEAIVTTVEEAATEEGKIVALFPNRGATPRDLVAMLERVVEELEEGGYRLSAHLVATAAEAVLEEPRIGKDRR